MSLTAMAWRYLRFRWFVSLLTLFGIAIGVALVSVVLALRHQSKQALSKDAVLYDLVAGGKGSPLQLILSSVYHLDSPTGNLPYSDYQRFQHDSRVLWSAPIGLGDNYKGFRIVGTEVHFFNLPDQDGKPFFQLARGRVFEDTFEVVIGSQVASSTSLDLDDVFFGTHGLVEVPGAEIHRDFPYRVSGVLAPTGTAQDRAIFGTLSSVWEIHESEDRLHSAILGSAVLESREKREATAILFRLKTPGLRLWMADEIRNSTQGIATVPVNEILRFQRSIIDPLQRILLSISAAVMVVAFLTVFLTLYQAAERRRQDIAILRALGALRSEIAFLVFFEGLMLAAIGIILGLLLGHGGLALGSETLYAKTGFLVHPWEISKTESFALLAMGLCGAIASLFPAITSYRRTPILDLQLNE